MKNAAQILGDDCEIDRESMNDIIAPGQSGMVDKT